MIAAHTDHMVVYLATALAQLIATQTLLPFSLIQQPHGHQELEAAIDGGQGYLVPRLLQMVMHIVSRQVMARSQVLKQREHLFPLRG